MLEVADIVRLGRGEEAEQRDSGAQRQIDERELRESRDGRREFRPAQRRGVRCRT